jgi:hypothetical protein
VGKLKVFWKIDVGFGFTELLEFLRFTENKLAVNPMGDTARQR